MNHLAPAPNFGDALVADLYVRLERLESEVRHLRYPPEPRNAQPRTPLTERTIVTVGEDTQPLLSSSAPTPPRIPWPTREPIGERELLDVAATMSADAFVGVDAAGIVRVWNRAAEELFGWRFEEVVGRPVPFLTPEQETEHRGLLDYPRSVIAGQDLATIRRRRDGHCVPVRLRLQEGPRGSVLFAFREDVPPLDDSPDPRPAMEPQPRTVVSTDVEAGLQSLVTLGRCAAGVAHDMNNMLAVLQGYGELLREQSPEARLSHMAGDIAFAAEQGGAVCRNLLSLLKPEQGTPPQTDLAAVLRRSERIWRTILGAKIAFRVTVAKDVAMARVHPGEFFQIVLNLMTNAADAMPNGGRVELALIVEDLAVGPADDLPAGRYAVLTMTDDGPGLPSEITARLGKLGGTTRPETNHGLGLMTIHNILNRSQGSLDIVSTQGSGATIRVLLREA